MNECKIEKKKYVQAFGSLFFRPLSPLSMAFFLTEKENLLSLYAPTTSLPLSLSNGLEFNPPSTMNNPEFENSNENADQMKSEPEDVKYMASNENEEKFKTEIDIKNMPTTVEMKKEGDLTNEQSPKSDTGKVEPETPTSKGAEKVKKEEQTFTLAQVRFLNSCLWLFHVVQYFLDEGYPRNGILGYSICFAIRICLREITWSSVCRLESFLWSSSILSSLSGMSTPLGNSLN